MVSPLRIASDHTSKAITKKINFTMASVQKIACPAGKDRLYVFDSHTSGLCIAVLPSGSKCFYLRYKINGASRRLKLGDFPEISVDNARDLAKKAIGRIAEGRDPQLERQAARAETTLGDLFEWYMREHADKFKRSAAKDRQRYEKHLAGWAKRRLSTITLQDVQQLHTRIGKDAPGQANRVLALLSCMYNKSRAMGFTGPNPAEAVKRYPETQRERFLNATELPVFLKALDEEPNQTWKDFFGLCLWTGARSGNVKSIQWAEVDLPSGTWTIPAEKFKTGKPMTVHLSAPAMAILTAREKVKDSDFVFPAVDGGRRNSASGHIQEPKKAWAELLERAGIADLWIHDLRRTLGSWQAATGANLPVIGKSLGHRNQSTTAIYARLNIDPVREAVDKATVAMQATTNPPAPVKVTKGKGKASKSQ